MSTASERESRINRLMSKVEKRENGCWIWTGANTGKGDKAYGNMTVGGRSVSAHRNAYTLLRGEIPGGMDLDHLCRVRLCVNPDHLEPVTRKVNLNRGFAATGSKPRRPKQICCRGHDISDPGNRYSNGACKACTRIRIQANRIRAIA